MESDNHDYKKLTDYFEEAAESQPIPKMYILEKKCEPKGARISGFDKILISIIIGIFFFILVVLLTSKPSNNIFGKLNLNHGQDKMFPGTIPILIYTIIFIFIVRFLMH